MKTLYLNLVCLSLLWLGVPSAVQAQTYPAVPAPGLYAIELHINTVIGNCGVNPGQTIKGVWELIKSDPDDLQATPHYLLKADEFNISLPVLLQDSVLIGDQEETTSRRRCLTTQRLAVELDYNFVSQLFKGVVEGQIKYSGSCSKKPMCTMQGNVVGQLK